MFGAPTRRKRVTSRKGVFNPEDEMKVKHTELGVWDLYEEKEPELANIPGSSRIERFLALKQTFPYLWRMLKDIGSIRSCWMLLIYYVALMFVGSLIPAVSLWCVNLVCGGSLLTSSLQVQGTNVENSGLSLCSLSYILNRRAGSSRGRQANCRQAAPLQHSNW
jgi:hypothetical protein